MYIIILYGKGGVIKTSNFQLWDCEYSGFFLIQAPGRAFYMLWTHILAPWIFAEAPSQEEMDPKQQKKLERKMKKEKIVYK